MGHRRGTGVNARAGKDVGNTSGVAWSVQEILNTAVHVIVERLGSPWRAEKWKTNVAQFAIELSRLTITHHATHDGLGGDLRETKTRKEENLSE
jgi:hypothetical protein